MKPTLSAVVFLFFCFSATAQIVSVEETVELALQKNFDIRVVRATSESAFNDYRFSNGAFLPVVSVNGGYSKSSNDSKSFTFANAETLHNGIPSTNLNGATQLTWTLFDGSRMFAVRKGLAETAALGEINIKNQMMNSVASVITNYYNIVRQKQQLKAIHELIAVNEERVKLAEKKLQVGTGGKPELLQAKVDYNANRILALQQETLIQQLKDQLNGLLGMGLPDVFEISDTIPINLEITLEDVVSGIEESNQALATARKNIDIAEVTLWQNRAARSPVISLVGAYNYTKTEATVGASAFSLKYSRNKGYNYGVSIAVPILNGFNANRLVNQAKILIERQRLVYGQQKTLAVVGVRNAYTSYENAKKALIIEEENILVAKENVFIALESFKRGVATYIELRTAQQTLADTYSQLILARYNAKAAETELYRLKGALLK